MSSLTALSIIDFAICLERIRLNCVFVVSAVRVEDVDIFVEIIGVIIDNILAEKMI